MSTPPTTEDFEALQRAAEAAKVEYQRARKALRKATRETIHALLAAKRWAPDHNFDSDNPDPRYLDEDGELLPVRPEKKKDIVLSDEWGCPGNVTKVCAYDGANDEALDTCLFCGEPVERD